MSLFATDFRIAASAGGVQQTFTGLVDTGSAFSFIPGSALRALGVQSIDTERFLLADGSVITRNIGEARVYIDGRDASTIVVFADEGIEPILGVHALESLRLVVDPLNETIASVEHLRA